MDLELANKGKKTVTQDNVLVSAHYAMSLVEKRLLVRAIAELDPNSKAWKEGRAEVIVTAGEWCDLYGGDRKSAYSQLRGAGKRLFERSVRIYGDSKKGKVVRWISAWEYNENEGRVAVTFSGPILYYLTGMIDEFTSYDLLGVSGLKSIHSVRIYELVSQFKSTGWRIISVDDLRNMIGIEPDGYKVFSDFRKRVLDRACTELTRKSDLEVSWEPIKSGRTIKSIKFSVKKKDQFDFFDGPGVIS